MMARHGLHLGRGKVSFPMWHPAAMLLVWVFFALILQWLPLLPVLILAVSCVLAAKLFAPSRGWRLFIRIRWLLLALLVMLLFMTPGEYLSGLPGTIGLTYEGLSVTELQLGRLLALLASLAVLHERLGTAGLLEGLYALMGPFSWRDKTVVRLMLVMEFAEQEKPMSWRDCLAENDKLSDRADVIKLRVASIGWCDKLLLAGAAVIATLAVAFS